MRILFFLLIGITHSFVFGNPESPSLDIEAQLLTEKIQSGENTTLQIDIVVPDGHHAYADQFKFKWIQPSGLKFTNYEFYPLISFNDPFSGKIKNALKGKSKVTGLVHFPATLQVGSYTGDLEVTYQMCSKKYCFFPKKQKVSVNFVVSTSSSQITSLGNSNSFTKPSQSIEEKLNESIILTLLFVFLMGILTSFTPCIFPMIPITLAVLGSTNKNKNRQQRFTISLVYVLGIAITYSFLGVSAALTGSLFGAMLSNPYVVAGISCVFVLMSLSMFGLYELQAPAIIRNRLSKTSTKTNYTGAFISGLISGIIASPCVGPVLVSILTYIANTQDINLGFILMFTFAFGMGMIFIAIGMFSNLQSKLPQAGEWMNLIKVLFGSVMLAFAIYFIYPILPIRITHGLISVAALIVGLYHMNWKSWKKLSRKILNLHMFILILIGGLFSVQTILGPNYFLYPKYRSFIDKGIYWTTWSKDAIGTSKKASILYFTADWCAACQELKVQTFSSPEVMKFQTDFNFFQFDATISTPELEALVEKYKINGLPTILFFDSNGSLYSELTLAGFEDAESFSKRLATFKQSTK